MHWHVLIIFSGALKVACQSRYQQSSGDCWEYSAYATITKFSDYFQSCIGFAAAHKCKNCLWYHQKVHFYKWLSAYLIKNKVWSLEDASHQANKKSDYLTNLVHEHVQQWTKQLMDVNMSFVMDYGPLCFLKNDMLCSASYRLISHEWGLWLVNRFKPRYHVTASGWLTIMPTTTITLFNAGNG